METNEELTHFLLHVRAKKAREQKKFRTWQKNPLWCLSCRPVPYSLSIHHKTLDGGLIGWYHLVSPSCVISPNKSKVRWLASKLHHHPDRVDVMICFWRLDFSDQTEVVAWRSSLCEKMLSVRTVVFMRSVCVGSMNSSYPRGLKKTSMSDNVGSWDWKILWRLSFSILHSQFCFFSLAFRHSQMCLITSPYKYLNLLF